jgi:hypothetical protein
MDRSHLIKCPVLWEKFKDVEETIVQGTQENLSPPVRDRYDPYLPPRLEECD